MIHNVKALEDYENEWQQQKYVKSFYWIVYIIIITIIIKQPRT